MNVAETLLQQEQALVAVKAEMENLYADSEYADYSSQNNARWWQLNMQKRAIEETIQSLSFSGPMPTSEVKAIHVANQHHKREAERSAKRKLLVEKVLKGAAK